MISQEKDTMNLMQSYRKVINRIENFKGENSYIVRAIERVSNEEYSLDRPIKNMKDVSKLLTDIAFNIL